MIQHWQTQEQCDYQVNRIEGLELFSVQLSLLIQYQLLYPLYYADWFCLILPMSHTTPLPTPHLTSYVRTPLPTPYLTSYVHTPLPTPYLTSYVHTPLPTPHLTSYVHTPLPTPYLTSYVHTPLPTPQGTSYVCTPLPTPHLTSYVRTPLATPYLTSYVHTPLPTPYLTPMYIHSPTYTIPHILCTYTALPTPYLTSYVHILPYLHHTSHPMYIYSPTYTIPCINSICFFEGQHKIVVAASKVRQPLLKHSSQCQVHEPETCIQEQMKSVMTSMNVKPKHYKNPKPST